MPLRIITYGPEWVNELPEWALAFDIPLSTRVERYLEAEEVLQNTTENETGEVKQKRLQAQRLIRNYGDVKGKTNMKKPTPDLWRMAKEYLELPENGSTTPVELPKDWAETERDPWVNILKKHRRLMYFKHPEPGTAFSYEDWKAGNSNKAVIDMVTERTEYGDRFKPVVPDYKSYKIALQDTFRKQGLQVIVKIDGIELTPEKPIYSGGSWQLDGQMNEHIVAVAMYPYDVQNVTETRISFRQQTPIPECFYRYATHRFAKEKYDCWNRPAHEYRKSSLEIGAIAEILGFREEDLMMETMPVQDISPYQNIGSVATPQGRLVTFPNVMEHRVAPFELLDPSLPGHHRSVKLYLVDPHYRVCSTCNVPPQQHDWWAPAVGDEFLKLKLPREISAEITNMTDNWPVGIEEAREHRLEMMKEHRWKDMARYAYEPPYGFW